MYEFRRLAMLEALRIIKKAGSKPAIPTQSALVQVKNSIGEINDIPVVKSKHVGMIRDGEQQARDGGLRDAVVIKVLKKAIKKGFSKNSGKTLITYKDKKSKKYDMIVTSWERNAIVIITAIQDKKDNPKLYFTSKHREDTKITTESFEIQDIEDIIILEDTEQEDINKMEKELKELDPNSKDYGILKSRN